MSLRDRVEGGTGSKERRKRAHILLLADISRDGGGLRDADIANGLSVGTATVERVRKLCVMEGLEAALVRTGQRGVTQGAEKPQAASSGWEGGGDVDAARLFGPAGRARGLDPLPAG